MHIEIPERLSEQEAVSNLIAEGGADFVSALRRSAHNAVDRMAWAGIHELVPQVAELNRTVAKLNRKNAALRGEKASLSQELEAVHASRSWRMTAPLHRIRAMLAGWREWLEARLGHSR